MKVNPLFASALLAAALALQAWTLREVVNCKVQIAELNARLAAHLNIVTTK